MCTCAVCVRKGTKYTERSVAHGDSTAEEISHAELSSIKHWRTDVSNPVLPHAGELTGQIDGDVWQCSHTSHILNPRGWPSTPAAVALIVIAATTGISEPERMRVRVRCSRLCDFASSSRI